MADAVLLETNGALQLHLGTRSIWWSTALDLRVGQRYCYMALYEINMRMAQPWYGYHATHWPSKI
jgi:hypothetical protein